ncbi:MAG: hypothetical protein COV44_06655 [Deltaproteobacteria bacterium CG11_big_fil_rev_8_21_14_0_20_45_16]|nr:MAG: hypothetical protein COV44_06655 [Deltaproteobacteria bacterium CG11_big_fil_rev_8_21_14_0_20_45_16]
MSLKIDESLWRQFDDIFENQEFLSWRRTMDSLWEQNFQWDDFARSCRTLFDLHLMNSKDPTKKRAFGYAYLAATGYSRIKKQALALTIIDQLKKACAPETMIKNLQEQVSNVVSSSSEVAPPDDSKQNELLEQLSKDFPGTAEVKKAFDFDVLESIPPLKRLHILSNAKVLIVEQTDYLFREGDNGSNFYILAEGKMQLERSGQVPIDLFEGAHLGELAAMSSFKRSGSVRAIEKSTLIEFSREDLVGLFIEFPKFEEGMSKSFYLRLFLHALRNIRAFDDFTDADLEEFFYFFKTKKIPKSKVIFTESEPSNEFYFILSGNVQIDRPSHAPLTLKGPSFLGEIAFLLGEVRSATATTLTETYLLVADGFMRDSLSREYPKIYEILRMIASQRESQNTKI